MRLAVLLFTIISLPLVAAPIQFKCDETKIRYYQKMVLQNETIKLCTFDFHQERVLTSESCSKGQGCLALKKSSTKLSLAIADERTTPASKLCDKVGGILQLFELYNEQDKKWERSSRCLFEDGSYVLPSYLFEVHKEMIN